jgi:hypothetical protein
MFGLMTHIFLDVSTNVVWWVLRKTMNGMYYIVWGDSNGKKHVKRIHDLEMEIHRLEEKVELLENYIKKPL